MLQGEDADEARERPAWLAGTESAEEGAASPAASGPSVGLPSAAGSAPGTATAQAAANGGAADLLDLLGESVWGAVGCLERLRAGRWLAPPVLQLNTHLIGQG